MLRKIRERRNIRLEDMGRDLNIPVNDLCDMEMAATRFAELLDQYEAMRQPK